MIHGKYEITDLDGNARYIPEPSMHAFEQTLAKQIALHRCGWCKKPLGGRAVTPQLNLGDWVNPPRRVINRMQYHPHCADEAIKKGIIKL